MVKAVEPRLRNVHFIINPASGRMEPILPLINLAFKDSDCTWDVSITKQAGDATRFAKELSKTGVDVIAVYGGDGSIMEVITGMIGSGIPLAIVPCGTGNVLATELGIPGGIKEACELIVNGPSTTRKIDLGQFNKRYFTQRASYGYEVEMVRGAKRTTKNRFGRLAYVLSFMGAMKKIKLATYDITVDGKSEAVKGVACIVANTGNMGFSAKFTLDKTIDISDGLLDVLVFKKVHIGLFRYFWRVLRHGTPSDDHELVAHWQGGDIRITSRPAQRVQCDGEVLDKIPIHAKIIPQAIEIIVPRTS
jgi:diacylglycerol kinase (ATP)